MSQRADGAPVAMPSVVVDDLWHELIVHTVAYERFCRDALGRFLHHTPEEAMTAQDAAANSGGRLRRTYELACEVEGTSLPLLFRVDALLRIRHVRRGLRRAPRRATVCLRHLPPVPAHSRSGGGSPGWAWGGGDGWAGNGAGGGGDNSGCGGGGGGGGCGGGS